MSEQEQLLVNAVLEAPDADEPRVVYADWLQQRGEPRGELVALQLAIAAGRGTPDIVAREVELRDRHEARWLGELGLVPGEAMFVRGFVERVTLHGVRVDRLLSVVERIAQVSPLRALSFRGADGQELDESAATELLESRWLAHVTELELSDCAFTGDALEAIIHAEHLDRLGSLALDRNTIDDDDIKILARAPIAKRLVRLQLVDNLVGKAGVKKAATAFTSLAALDLTSNGLDTEDVAGLAKAPATLTELELSGNSITTGLFAMLADATHLRLARLGLASNTLEDDGYTPLRKARHLHGLAHLDLNDNLIDDAGVEELVQALASTHLVTLGLAKNFFGRTGARVLAKAVHLAGLERLDLRDSEYLKKSDRAVLAKRFGDKVLLDTADHDDD